MIEIFENLQQLPIKNPSAINLVYRFGKKISISPESRQNFSAIVQKAYKQIKSTLTYFCYRVRCNGVNRKDIFCVNNVFHI
jgi:hypothetical protein